MEIVIGYTSSNSSTHLVAHSHWESDTVIMVRYVKAIIFAFVTGYYFSLHPEDQWWRCELSRKKDKACRSRNV